MAGTAVLERELNTRNERVDDIEQAKKTSSYFDSLYPRTQAAQPDRAPQEKRMEETVAAYDPVADRIDSYYQTPAAPARKKVLFDDYEYINGELMRKNPETEGMTRAFDRAAVAEPEREPVREEPKDSDVSAAAVTAEPQADDDEDALPTRRTMESVIRSASVQEITITDTRTGFKAAITSLSTKMKIVLLSVATAILLAIVLICVNTSIIRSLDSDLTNLKNRATEQQTTYENLQKESDLYTDPDSGIVADWAQSNGMTK